MYLLLYILRGVLFEGVPVFWGTPVVHYSRGGGYFMDLLSKGGLFEGGGYWRFYVTLKYIFPYTTAL